MSQIVQNPQPGTSVLSHKGDIVKFFLTLDSPREGEAWLRTNVGNARKQRREIIHHVENDSPILSMDWQDIPMRKVDDTTYNVSIPLTEVGFFEAKTLFLPEGSNTPIWPEGENVSIKVEPAHCCCANTIYTAFVRQFGQNKYKLSASRSRELRIKYLEKQGYSVIPTSGTFRDLMKELDFIMGKLRFKIIQLLPIHPVPTTFARMGRFGSPFAVQDFMDVDHALTEFDRRTTPLQQFVELVDAVHQRSGKLIIDIPINHTGWASRLQTDHPEWFARGKDQTFESPGAWGVTWEDLSKLDYTHRGLWRYMAEVFLFWCSKGVDGFRCDAGYMIPSTVWQYITAKVRDDYPDTIFLLEGLGGKMETMEELLSKPNLDWAYSELFQNYDRNQVESCLSTCIRLSSTKGLQVHYAETHDNNRLASVSRGYALMRTAFSALCSQNGAFGITNGLEWFAEEKIDVHNAPSLNWGNENNQAEHIARLNAILESHVCFGPRASLQLVERNNSNAIALLRSVPETEEKILVLVNLSHDRENTVIWPENAFPAKDRSIVDLLSGRNPSLSRRNDEMSCLLAPGETLCLSKNKSELELVEQTLQTQFQTPALNLNQRLRAKTLEIAAVCGKDFYNIETNIENWTKHLSEDPSAFCSAMTKEKPLAVISWKWPRDLKRTVMVPPGSFLFITSEHPFEFGLFRGQHAVRRETSLPLSSRGHFALVLPLREPEEPSVCRLKMTVYEPGTRRKGKADILYLSRISNATVKREYNKEEIKRFQPNALCVNTLGDMARVHGMWGTLRSQYDAMLAVNPDPECPADRIVMLTRCRLWLVSRGYSQPLNSHCLKTFRADNDNSATWVFNVSTGRGKSTVVRVRFEMIQNRHAAKLEFSRENGKNPEECSEPVKIIIRPDIEDRISHVKTKAYAGADTAWPNAISVSENSFVFSPSRNHRLKITSSSGKFVSEPEWTYMIEHPEEIERGLDGNSDIFSPGYFSFYLDSKDRVFLNAEASFDNQPNKTVKSSAHENKEQSVSGKKNNISLIDAMLPAMKQFIVKRNNLKTVLAGYPWFLDWGRDTLICLRGIIEAGLLEEARQILREFARFEEKGTLPNMIHGDNVSNRDTSDAPLWFFVACSDLMKRENSSAFANEDCEGRTIREVLMSIGKSYMEGTPNGIIMDSDSGLIFSPSHFTWMDTNYPACTPREGYPVEIQALWHFALGVLAKLDPDGPWKKISEKAKTSFMKFFTRDEFLADCIHTSGFKAAREGTVDDFLRPNQLLAVTLGLVQDKKIMERVVESCGELLVPGAIRSLADRVVEHELPLYHNSRPINNPKYPYQGTYAGDEDTRRKPAYHNGTAWTWLFPSYSEAVQMVWGEQARDTALSVLSSSAEIINRDCVGQVPEITDGNFPHILRGCGAQAWGVTELYRVLAILDNRI